MRTIRPVFLLLLVVTLFSTACSDFSKIQKDKDPEKQFTAAMDYYKKEDYVKAQLLFEQLAASALRGSEKSQDIFYYQAMTNYKMGDYIVAGYQFRTYHRSYPTSERAEECLYLSAYCHYLESPPYSLDQTDTRDAINEFQYFIKLYPQSTRVPECNKLVDKLHEKLEKKAYMIAKQYLRIGDYRAASAAFGNMLHDYPDTKYREEILYLTVKANYQLTLNSIPSKIDERVATTIESYSKFKAAYPVSPYSEEVESLYSNTLKYQQQLADEKKKQQRKNS